MSQKLVVLKGPPAAGKSTKAKELYQHYGAEKAVLVSRDSIRDSMGKYWVPSREGLVSTIETSMIENALENNFIPIVDATNLNPKTIQHLESIAKSHAAEIEWIECIVPFSEALRRDKDRQRPVGEKVLRSFYERYYPEWMIFENETRTMEPWDPNKPKAIICEVDSILALRTGRAEGDYESVSSDLPDFRATALFNSLISECDFEVIFITSRPETEKCMAETIEWLESHVKPHYWQNRGVPESNWLIYFYNEGEQIQLYEKRIKPWNNVAAVFTNKDCDKWRDNGLLCFSCI